jgi:plastocyanin
MTAPFDSGRNRDPGSSLAQGTPRHRIIVIVAGVMAIALVASERWIAAAQGPGRVAGTVRLTMASSAPSGATVYGGRSVAPRPKAQPEIRNVVVFFADAPKAATRTTRATIAQREEQFFPHVVAVTVGSSVDFPNDDTIFHNVFSLSRPATFDLGRYPSGASRARTFQKPGIVKVYCQIHSHMSAVVRVFDHGWFTIPADSGAFAIDGVPPGSYTLVAWHERIGERRDRVTIRAGGTTEITFTLPVLEPTP